jgi:FkbM family methyltransferase
MPPSRGLDRQPAETERSFTLTIANLTRCYENFGLRGVLGKCSYRLFGRPREIAAQLPSIRSLVHLRLRTTDQNVYSDILLRGEYAFELPFSPKTIVDVGANIGIASIYFANKYKEAKIIAIEAESSNFDLLARNVRPYPAITPVHAALWSRDGVISVADPDPATGAFGNWAFVTREGPGRKVRAITMRTLMKEMHLPSVDLLKIDIEGAEKEVFGACDWMDDIGCLMIELHDRYKPGCSEGVDSVARGFSKVQRGETTLYVREK